MASKYSRFFLKMNISLSLTSCLLTIPGLSGFWGSGLRSSSTEASSWSVGTSIGDGEKTGRPSGPGEAGDDDSSVITAMGGCMPSVGESGVSNSASNDSPGPGPGGLILAYLHH